MTAARRYGGVPNVADSKSGRASVELFTGGGGLALGTHLAGFDHFVVTENRAWARQTLLRNHALNVDSVTERVGKTKIDAYAPLLDDWYTRDWFRDAPVRKRWPLLPGGVVGVDWTPLAGKVALLAAGAPCQPFSLGGSHKGDEDPRNLFPEVMRAARELRPDIVIVENVRGLARPSFEPYFEYILDQLRLPSIGPKPDEGWRQHHRRLRREIQAGSMADDSYWVDYRTVDAADFGLPQRRHRVFVVAVRQPLSEFWSWPTAEFSGEALLWAQVHGDYWERRGLRRPNIDLPSSVARRLMRGGKPAVRPWRTLRDGISDLPYVIMGRDRTAVANHRGIPGARLYPRHSGSQLDAPAKTVKAGTHGCPGGEHVVLLDNGGHRYLTVRECARLQGFPDEYVFEGPRTETMRQIGNAVPVPLARLMGLAARACLERCTLPPTSGTVQLPLAMSIASRRPA